MTGFGDILQLVIVELIYKVRVSFQCQSIWFWFAFCSISTWIELEFSTRKHLFQFISFFFNFFNFFNLFRRLFQFFHSLAVQTTEKFMVNFFQLSFRSAWRTLWNGPASFGASTISSIQTAPRYAWRLPERCWLCPTFPVPWRFDFCSQINQSNFKSKGFFFEKKCRLRRLATLISSSRKATTTLSSLSSIA